MTDQLETATSDLPPSEITYQLEPSASDQQLSSQITDHLETAATDLPPSDIIDQLDTRYLCTSIRDHRPH